MEGVSENRLNRRVRLRVYNKLLREVQVADGKLSTTKENNPRESLWNRGKQEELVKFRTAAGHDMYIAPPPLKFIRRYLPVRINRGQKSIPYATASYINNANRDLHRGRRADCLSFLVVEVFRKRVYKRDAQRVASLLLVPRDTARNRDDALIQRRGSKRTLKRRVEFVVSFRTADNASITTAARAYELNHGKLEPGGKRQQSRMQRKPGQNRSWRVPQRALHQFRSIRAAGPVEIPSMLEKRRKKGRERASGGVGGPKRAETHPSDGVMERLRILSLESLATSTPTAFINPLYSIVVYVAT
ncbi:hypothetical protein DBV15_08734 [Temnothorax longispinosus]|uniref:Uncharacterized protein n=1 Tax=Temnothorax longispinosus TaxID=300112 RepID=A0A4S2KQE7_9HYME|nr:hypothetical protein DBV15_08734 [Temnothorax longispinosus]